MGRIEWATKCGHLSPGRAALAREAKMYPEMERPNAPFDRDAPCGEWGSVVGMCIFGCYPPDQQLMFDGGAMAIGEAIERGAQRVAALASLEDFDRESPELVEEEIHKFVRGETSEVLVRLTAASGEKIVVTGNHPVIETSGRIVSAGHVIAGTTVLKGVAGDLLIVAAESIPYEGVVLNVQPKTQTVAGNILSCQGFLVGSLRFQNEWQRDKARLFLRDAISADL